MVSLITEKLGEQTLRDSIEYDCVEGGGLSCSSLKNHIKFYKPASSPGETCCSSTPRVQRNNQSVSGTTTGEPGDMCPDKQCVCSSYCDILPPKRHRQTPTNGRRSDFSFIDWNETKFSSSNNTSWRPTARSSSVWRSVSGQSPKQFAAVGRIAPPELSPLAIIPSMSSERSSPSDSPSPRPASASSGFFDSSQGSLNYNMPLDSSGGGQVFSYIFSMTGGSETLEERISSFSGSMMLDTSAIVSSESLPMICEVSCLEQPPVSPFSCDTQTTQPVRCRSQPTVLHQTKHGRDRVRNTGKKRRWPVCDDHRPKLDFLKMKETAYDKAGRSSGRFRTSHHVQFAPDVDVDHCTSTYRCKNSPDCFTFCKSTLKGQPDDSLDCHRNRPSIESCSSDTCDDQQDVMAFSDEINSKFLRVGGEDGIEEEAEEVFNVDLGHDLDIDQIEND